MKCMEISQSSIESKINHDYICLIDSSTTYIILREKKYFSYLIMKEANYNTIAGSTNLIENSGKAT